MTHPRWCSRWGCCSVPWGCLGWFQWPPSSLQSSTNTQIFHIAHFPYREIPNCFFLVAFRGKAAFILWFTFIWQWPATGLFYLYLALGIHFMVVFGLLRRLKAALGNTQENTAQGKAPALGTEQCDPQKIKLSSHPVESVKCWAGFGIFWELK